MSNTQQYEADDMDYGTNAIRHTVRNQSSKRREQTRSRRRSKSPTSVNGIHRRRKRKMSW